MQVSQNFRDKPRISGSKGTKVKITIGQESNGDVFGTYARSMEHLQ